MTPPNSRATAAATQARANRRTQFAVAGMLCTTLTSATPPAPWQTLQVSTFAGFVLRIVRPSASFVTVVEPPFCSMWAWVTASTWHAEHTDILAEVAIGLPTVVGLGDCFDRPVKNVVACTAVSATGIVAGADMTGVAAIELARIDDIGEVVHRAAEAVDDERRARGAAHAAVMDGVDHVLEVDRLLPQAVDSRRVVSVCRMPTSVDAGLWQATQTCVLSLRLLPCRASTLWQTSHLAISTTVRRATGAPPATLP